MNQYRVTIKLGGRVITITEHAASTNGARLSACRYLKAMGYDDIPDSISVLKIGEQV